MANGPRLAVFGRTQVCGHGVVLDGLVQHESQQTRPVGHGGPQVPLLLKQLVQFVPLGNANMRKQRWQKYSASVVCRGEVHILYSRGAKLVDIANKIQSS